MLFSLILVASSVTSCLGDWWLPVYVKTPEPIDARSRMLEYKTDYKPDGEQQAYRQINDFLATNGASDNDFDLKLMLDKAHELYYAERNKIFRNKQLIESLEYLFKLFHLDRDENDDCSDKILEILEHNNHGTESKAYEMYRIRKKNGRPVDAIVHHYFVLHAKRCQQVYIDRFRKIHSAKNLEQIENFLVELINKRLVMSYHRASPNLNKGEHKLKLDTLIGELTSIDPLEMSSSGVILHGLLELVTRNNDAENKNHLDNLLNRKDYLDKKGFKQLISKYLVEPCRAYVRIYGPSVFELVLFDSKVMGQAYVTQDQNLLDFYYAWANYKLCKQANANGEDKLVDMLLEFCRQRCPK